MIAPHIGVLSSPAGGSLRCILASALLLALLWCRPAMAGPQQDFAAHYDHGVSLYGTGLYADAIAEFKEAYAMQQVPLVLINIAQTHLKLNQPKEVLRYCDQYLSADPHPRPQIQTRLDGYIATARALVEAQEKRTAAPLPAQPAVAPPPVAQSQQARSPAVMQQQQVRKRRPAWRLGAGLGAFAAGGLLGGLGASALTVSGQCIGSTGCAFRYDTTTPGVALTASGGALIISGVVLLALPGPWQQVER